MRFNRRIGLIHAISFDLDDTLYSNHQVMINTDLAMQAYFQQRFIELLSTEIHNNLKQSASCIGDHIFWLPYYRQVLAVTPLLKNDVTEMRKQTYIQGFNQLGLSKSVSADEAEQALSHFLMHRNKVIVPDNIHHFLTQLKQNYRLIAISNGNVCTKEIGLSPYFEHTFHAEKGIKQKPESDLFHLACHKLQLAPQHILHVGDCGHADILGAQRAGFHSAWLNCYDVGKPISALPDIELNQVTDLAKIF